MPQQPKTGDHVRLTAQDFLPDYRPGDTGTVESGPHPIPSGGSYFIVLMDRGRPGAAAVVFTEREIELAAAVVAVSG